MSGRVLLGIDVPEAFDEGIVLVPEDGRMSDSRDVVESRRTRHGLPDLEWIQRSRHERQVLDGATAVGNARNGDLEVLPAEVEGLL